MGKDLFFFLDKFVVCLICRIMGQVAVLHEECEREKETCINLEDCQNSQKLLTEAEELGDRIEGLDAQE